MNDPHAENHWKDLASILGAVPAAETEPPRPVASTSLPIAKPAAPKRPKPAATAKAANWDSIALDLGIDPPPRAAEPRQPAAPPPPPRSVETSPPQRPQITSVTPESGDESPNFFDEKFDFEEPFDLLESAEGKAAAESSTSQPPDQETTGKSRRRRRRRPRRREENAADQARPAADGALPANEEPPEPEAPRRRRDEETAEAGERQSERRRRPRRGKRRGDDRQSEGKSPDRVAAKAESDADEHFHEDHDEFADEEIFADGENQPRAGFRGIPTWDEAVGLLIEKNLASRSKRPADAPRRGGDNRGRQGRQPRQDKRRG